MSRTINATIGAWITPYAAPVDLHRDDPLVVIRAIAWSASDMSSSGWARIGSAEVTLVISDEKQIIANRVESLRAEQTKVRADAQAAVTRIDREIQQLLALDHAPERAT